MFAAHHLDVPVSLADAQARLESLVREGGLRGASMQSYDGGVEYLVRAGPMPKLVRIRFLAPVYRDGEMSLGLRWEATGVAGGLFPVLDADLTLTRAGAQTTKLALVGSYRPPFGAIGVGLDKAILHQVAANTIRALLSDVADTITGGHGGRENQGGENDSRDHDNTGTDARRHRDA